ncbi:response regulator [Hylemonella gracilis]|uniref:PAS sensor protein n=1 Tax=Hylemonella gracilis ATCC 19624 TaxID=887062 RepID=F3KWW3_9BURK|nr:response regulator [Hylemonella gracilis]EGI75750.1 PAS sensor protein [Hylemonella gracilis ATCC 19624]
MASTAHPTSAGLATGDEGARVLVVDDDVLNLRVASRLLREMGCRGALAPDGRTALDLVRKEAFDLVLLDISMPEFNGQDTLLALRELAGQRLPIVMVTGHDDEATRRHYLALGADGLLPKPLSIPALRDVMRGAGLRMPG